MYCLKDPTLGEGVVLHIESDRTIIYLGHNEWLTEFVRFAVVEFAHGRENVLLKDLIMSEQVRIYESLRPGDFIVYGKRKQAPAIVLQVATRKRTRRPYISDVCVIIIEDGIKKRLSLRREIVSVKRVLE